MATSSCFRFRKTPDKRSIAAARCSCTLSSTFRIPLVKILAVVCFVFLPLVTAAAAAAAARCVPNSSSAEDASSSEVVEGPDDLLADIASRTFAASLVVDGHLDRVVHSSDDSVLPVYEHERESQRSRVTVVRHWTGEFRVGSVVKNHGEEFNEKLIVVSVRQTAVDDCPIAWPAVKKRYFLFLNGSAPSSDSNDDNTALKKWQSIGLPEKFSKKLAKTVRENNCRDCGSPPVSARMDGKPVRSKYGHEFELKCRVTGGRPKPVIHWYKDDRLLSPSERIIMQNRGAELLVLDTDQSDAGQYTCRAVNVLGTVTSTSSTRVVVTMPPATNKHGKLCPISQQKWCLNDGTCYFVARTNTTYCVCVSPFRGPRCEDYDVDLPAQPSLESASAFGQPLAFVGLVLAAGIFLLLLLIAYYGYRNDREIAVLKKMISDPANGIVRKPGDSVNSTAVEKQGSRLAVYTQEPQQPLGPSTTLRSSSVCSNSNGRTSGNPNGIGPVKQRQSSREEPNPFFKNLQNYANDDPGVMSAVGVGYCDNDIESFHGDQTDCGDGQGRQTSRPQLRLKTHSAIPPGMETPSMTGRTTAGSRTGSRSRLSAISNTPDIMRSPDFGVYEPETAPAIAFGRYQSSPPQLMTIEGSPIDVDDCNDDEESHPLHSDDAVLGTFSPHWNGPLDTTNHKPAAETVRPPSVTDRQGSMDGVDQRRRRDQELDVLQELLKDLTSTS